MLIDIADAHRADRRFGKTGDVEPEGRLRFTAVVGDGELVAAGLAMVNLENRDEHMVVELDHLDRRVVRTDFLYKVVSGITSL